MKNKFKKIGVTVLIIGTLITGIVLTGCKNNQLDETTTNISSNEEMDVKSENSNETENYGAKGASTTEDYTIKEMLQYALEDEHLAYAEYELIINELGAERPFTNIIKAEEKHIEEVEILYDAYDMEIPEVDASEHIILPNSIEEALYAGVDAEIENIAMYEKFLSQDIPDDIREVFVALKEASESHLAAFEGSNGQGEGAGQSGGNRGSN
ncbi:hypothetical protein [Clostridium sp. DL1XJH146]